jgi:WhiB family redox-sensing transcriptional regulator
MMGEAMPATELAATPGAIAAELDPVDKAINYCVNHPAKMLTLLVMAERPDTDFTTHTLGKEITTKQGDELGWDWGSGNSSAGAYCSTSLLPAGLIKQTSGPDTDVRGPKTYRVTDDGLTYGVPLFGSLLDLEVRTGLSVQQVFGLAKRGAERDSQVSSSLARMRILKYLREHEDEPINLAALHRQVPREGWVATRAVTKLQEAGVVHLLRKTDPGHRRLVLAKPDSAKMRLYKGHMTRPATLALYDATAHLYRRGFRELSGAQLLEEVMDYCKHRPEVRADDVWSTLTGGNQTCVRFVDAHLFGGNTGKKAPRTRVAINPDVAGPIDELVRNVEAVRSSPAYRDLASEWAMDLIRKPATLAYIMAKARSHSSMTKPDRAHNIQRTAALKARAAGWVSLKQRLTIDMDWRDKAACKEMDPAIFEGSDEATPETQALTTALAKQTCRGCSVRLACLKWAVDQPEEFGVWGGYDAEERQQLDPSFHALMGAMTLRI